MDLPTVQVGFVVRPVTVSARTPHHIDVATIPAGTQVLVRHLECKCCLVIWIAGTRLSQVVKAATVADVSPLPRNSTGQAQYPTLSQFVGEDGEAARRDRVASLPRLSGGMVGF